MGQPPMPPIIMGFIMPPIIIMGFILPQLRDKSRSSTASRQTSAGIPKTLNPKPYTLNITLNHIFLQVWGYLVSAAVPIICVIIEGSMPICLNMLSICFLGGPASLHTETYLLSRLLTCFKLETFDSLTLLTASHSAQDRVHAHLLHDGL